MNDTVFCPYCQEEIIDLHEWFNEGDECVEGVCPNCGEDIDVCQTHHITYTSFKKGESEE